MPYLFVHVLGRVFLFEGVSFFFSDRVTALEKKLVFIEKREKEETAALENMIHMVEKSLELTTVGVLNFENAFFITQKLKSALQAVQLIIQEHVI